MLTADDLSYAYGDTDVLSGVSAHFDAGESVALVGPSGCGKTTLLYCLSGLLRPKSGRVLFEGREVSAGDDEDRARLRRSSFGFVFQSAELVPELTIRENVALPLDLAGVRRKQRAAQVDVLLERLGLADLGDRRPARLSGGQRQRAAVARAVVHRPSVVFADEPTGALDSANGLVVMDLLLQLSKEHGTTVVLVTHDPALAAKADRSIGLIDGRVDTEAAR